MTPHNRANIREIAKTVIMPGDPIRAKVMTERFLENYKLVNDVRGMYAYTGTYKGVPVTIMASGMGMPSMGIYSYELFKFYDVDNIIRVGSAGAYTDELNLYDIVLANSAYSESTFGLVQNNETRDILESSNKINEVIRSTALESNIKIIEGTLHSSDVFYKENNKFRELYDKYKCLACEMESFALFHNANTLGKNATCLVTISDNLVTHEETTSEERQNSFDQMFVLALESVIKL